MKKTWITLCLLSLFCATKAQERVSAEKLTPEELSAYVEHPEEIGKQAFFNGNEKTTELLMQYKVPKELQHALFRLVLEREFRKLTYNYLYPDSVFKRVQLKQSVENQCADSIDRILISYNDISGPNLQIALEYPLGVGIKKRQYEAIMNKALAMRKERLRNPKVNLWEREFSFLDSVLNKKQLRDFFVQKYMQTLTKEMNDSWQKLKKNNLAEELDSTSACAHIYMYNLSLHQVNDLYKYNQAKRQSAIKALEAKAPKPIQLLNGLQRKEQAEKALQGKGKNKKKEEKGNLFW